MNSSTTNRNKDEVAAKGPATEIDGSSRESSARSLLSSPDRKKRLSRKPELVERRRWYENLRDTNQKIVRECRDLTHPYPDGQLPPWEALRLTNGEIDGGGPSVAITSGPEHSLSPTTAKQLVPAQLSPSATASEAAPSATPSAGFNTFMLDLAEESMLKSQKFDLTTEKTFLDLPIIQYNRQVHFELGLDAASRWLRPLNKLAKKSYFDVKSKLSKGQGVALRSGAGVAPVNKSFARKPVSRAQQTQRENRFQKMLGSPHSSMSEGAQFALDPPRSKARSRLLGIISSAALGSGSMDEEIGLGEQLEQGSSTSYLAAGSVVSADTAGTRETSHQGARKICICFPGISASHSYFLPWGQEMDMAGVELWAVCLPGRANNFRKPPAESVHLTAGIVGDCMASLGILEEQGVGLDMKRRMTVAQQNQKHGNSHSSGAGSGVLASGSVASSSSARHANGNTSTSAAWEWDSSSATGSCVCLFGHSVGALIAFETARYLRRAFSLDAPHLFLSCIPNPDFVTAHNRDKYSTKRHTLLTDVLINKLADMGDVVFNQLHAHRKRLFGLTGDDDEWDSDLDSDEGSTDEFGRAIDHSSRTQFDLLATALPLARADFRLLECYAYELADDAAAKKSGVFAKEDEYARERRRERERLQGVAVTTVTCKDDAIVSGEDHLKCIPVSAKDSTKNLLLKSSKKQSSRQGTADSGGGRASRRRSRGNSESFYGSGDDSGSDRSPDFRRVGSSGGVEPLTPGSAGIRGGRVDKARVDQPFQDLFSPDGDNDDDDATSDSAQAHTGKEFTNNLIAKLARELSEPEQAGKVAQQGSGVQISQDYVDSVEDWRLVTMMSSGERDGTSLQLVGGGHHRCLLVPANQHRVVRDILVKMRAIAAIPADSMDRGRYQAPTDTGDQPGSPQSLASGWSRGL